MKIKTFESTSLQQLEDDINGFEVDHDVRATQTHVTSLNGGGLVYTAVLFYKEGAQ